MKLWNNLPLAAKIIIPVCAVLLTGLGVSTTLNTISASTELMNASMQLGREAAREGEATVILQFQRAKQVAKVLAEQALGAKQRGEPREMLLHLATEASRSEPKLLGTWYEFATDAYDADAPYVGAPTMADAKGRFTLYVTNDNGKVALQPIIEPEVDINTKDYFYLAFNSAKTAVTEPYMLTLDGKDTFMVSIAEPIMENGKPIGVAGVDIALTQLQEQLNAIKPLGDGSVYMLSPGGNWVSYKDMERVGKSLAETQAALVPHFEKAAKGEALEISDYSNSLQTNVYRLFEPVELVEGQPWVLVTNLVGSTIEAPTNALVRQSLIVAACLILFLVVAMIVLIRMLAAKPVTRLSQTINTLAEGNTSVTVPMTGRGDELGVMAKAVEFFRQKLVEIEELRRKTAEAEKEAAAARRKGMLDLADSFESSVKGVVQAVSASAVELESNAQSMAAVAEEANMQSTAVSAATTQCSANVSTVAAAAEEMSASIVEISRQVVESSNAARGAVGETDAAANTVQELARAAEEIGDIVRLISDIAGQTNLLALNATIEAARAGDAGKGFAVVASEVKSLANQTGRAAEDITARIQRIQSVTSNAVTAMDGVRSTIGKVEAISTAIASAVEEQSAATREISGNAAQAATGTDEVARNVEGVKAAAGDAGNAASQVLGASAELARQAESLRKEVDSFIARVRAG